MKQSREQSTPSRASRAASLRPKGSAPSWASRAACPPNAAYWRQKPAPQPPVCARNVSVSSGAVAAFSSSQTSPRHKTDMCTPPSANKNRVTVYTICPPDATDPGQILTEWKSPRAGKARFYKDHLFFTNACFSLPKVYLRFALPWFPLFLRTGTIELFPRNIATGPGRAQDKRGIIV